MNFKTTVHGVELFNPDKIKIGFELLENKLGYKELLEALINMHSVTERASVLEHLIEKAGYEFDPEEMQKEIDERYQIDEFYRKRLEEYQEKCMMESERYRLMSSIEKEKCMMESERYRMMKSGR